MSAALLYECFSGIAGDMHMAAMLDLGLPESHLVSELAKLGIDEEFSIEIQQAKKHGIQGTQVKVNTNPQEKHAHRNLADISKIIEQSELSQSVKSNALGMFQNLAEAEARVHGTDVEKIHFHEVGAIDAIVDIVAASVALDYFKPSNVYCHTVELGSGMVKCSHGLMPVPAPATALLMEGKPTTRGNVSGESTTPTGACILDTVVTQWRNPTTFRAEKTGYGIGQKNFERPNAVRVSLGELEDATIHETNVLIECNIDDMSPEAYEPLLEKLFEEGSNDVFLTPIIMKKSRPGIKLSVLANESIETKLVDCILEHSTSIGVRSSKVSKHMLPREIQSFDTPYGQVKVKISSLPNGRKRWKVEHDDIKSATQDQSLDYLSLRSRIEDWIERDMDKRSVR